MRLSLTAKYSFCSFVFFLNQSKFNPNQITTATFNAGGYKKHPQKLHETFENGKEYDILVLTETHFKVKEDAAELLRIFEEQFLVYLCGSKDEGHAGLALLVNRRSRLLVKRKIFDYKGRAIAVMCELESKLIYVLAVYAPADRVARPIFFQELNELTGKNFRVYEEALLLGDLNFVEDRNLDRSSVGEGNEAGGAQFGMLKGKFDLVDVYRYRNPNGREYSFFSESYNSQSRIDRVYATRNIADSVVSFEFKEMACSDHRMVAVTWKTSFLKVQFAKGHFKLSPYTISKTSDTYDRATEIVQKAVAGIRRKSDGELWESWDGFKESIATELQLLEARNKRLQARERSQIETEIKEVKTLLSTYGVSDILKRRLERAKARLKEHDDLVIKVRLMKTHFQGYDHDKVTIATSKMIQRKSMQDKLITSIKTATGVVLDDQLCVIKEIREQYDKLFQSKGIDEAVLAEFLAEKPHATVSEEQGERLNREIMVDEISSAIQTMAKGKSPGRDGLTSDFYKEYHDLLVPLLFRLFGEILRRGEMPASMYLGLVVQIYKGEGDKSERSNWRPITLLNTDYKVLAKVFGQRLKLVMRKIVHPDQTNSVPRRDIRDGIMSFYNIVSFTNEKKMDAVVLSVDHMSAFDIIEWEYLRHVFSYFKLGPTFIQWMAIIYRKGCVQSSVLVNGYMTQPFYPTRGIRQGCPLSSLFYVLVSEVVTNVIRRRESIKGLKIDDRLFKCNCFADDSNFTVADFDAVDRIFEIYDKFQKASGATLKKAKTKIMLLGEMSAEQVPVRYRGFLTETLKLYGVYFSRKGPTEENWVKTSKGIESLQSKFVHKDTSFWARAKVLETYFLSKLWYAGMWCPPSNIAMKNWEREMDRYFWFPYTTNLVNKNIIKLPTILGGVEYPDIMCKIKSLVLMIYIRRVKTNPPWSAEFDMFYNRLKWRDRDQLRGFRVPGLYKWIRRAELDSGLEWIDGGKIRLGGEEYQLKDVKTKLIYKTLIEREYGDATKKCEDYWKERFHDPHFKMKVFLTSAKVKYANGYTKNIHWKIKHKVLYTRSLQNHISPRNEANCKFCLAKSVRNKEDTLHCIVKCERLRLCWGKVESLLARTDNSVKLSYKTKIFGIYKAKSKIILNLCNIIIYTVQRAIWVTRNILEDFDLEKDPWEYFKAYFLQSCKRAHEVMSEEDFEGNFIETGVCVFEEGKVNLNFV